MKNEHLNTAGFIKFIKGCTTLDIDRKVLSTQVSLNNAFVLIVIVGICRQDFARTPYIPCQNTLLFKRIT